MSGSSMRALRVLREEGSSATPELRVVETSVPQPGADEVLIAMRASGVQPSDVLNARGSFSLTTYPRTPGRDFAGVVVRSSGGSNGGLGEGAKVFGTSGGTFSFSADGAHAQYAVVREAALAEMPRGMSFVQAGSVGTQVATAALVLKRAGLRKGEDRVMVLGAGGGVGLFAVQIARARGCKVITVGRHAGFDIDSSSDPELRGALELTEGKGPDVVVDTVGDLKLQRAAIDVLGKNGRFAFIAAPRGGLSTELSVDVLSLYRRQISLVGCNSLVESQLEAAETLRELAPLFETGALKAPEEKDMSIISLDQAPEAYAGRIKKACIVFD